MRLAFGLVLSVLVLLGCSEQLSVEQHIIANLRAMETAAEEGEHFDFMTYVAETFEGQSGSMDRRAFHRFMIYQMNQNRRLHAQFFPIHVRESGESGAIAQFKILVTGGAGLLPENGQFFDVTTDWLLADDEWLLDSADWQTVQLPDGLPIPN